MVQQQQLLKTLMSDPFSRRPHSKRFPSITDTIRNNLLQSHPHKQAHHQKDGLIHHLNSPTANALSPPQQPSATLLAARPAQSSKQQLLHSSKHLQNQLPVAGLMQPISKGLRRVLSVDRVSLRMNASQVGRGKMVQNRLAVQPVLSKRSTGQSTQSEEEALREENQWFKELCAAGEGRLMRLEKEIENEQRVQAIRRHLYQQSINRLRRVAGEEGGNDNEELCCDCLSVASNDD